MTELPLLLGAVAASILFVVSGDRRRALRDIRRWSIGLRPGRSLFGGIVGFLSSGIEKKWGTRSDRPRPWVVAGVGAVVSEVGIAGNELLGGSSLTRAVTMAAVAAVVVFVLAGATRVFVLRRQAGEQRLSG